jgi:hypothetical protein
VQVKRSSGKIDVTRRKRNVSGFRESTGTLQGGSIVEESRCVEYGGYPRHDRWQMKMEAGYERFDMEDNGGRTDSGGISECRGESPE